MSVPETTFGGGKVGEPAYREVEEHGETKLVLMQRYSSWSHTPGYRRLVTVDPPPGIDLAFDYEWVPPQTVGRSWWEKV